uniref:Uncharacterized protein n=1 Tax=Arundo donax TaxID=35708 RepID=A0A0A9CJY7_ARUDO
MPRISSSSSCVQPLPPPAAAPLMAVD